MVSAIESEPKSTLLPASFDRLKFAITKATPEDHCGDVVDHLSSETKESGQSAFDGEMIRSCAIKTVAVRLRFLCLIILQLDVLTCFQQGVDLAVVVLHSRFISTNQKTVIRSRT